MLLIPLVDRGLLAQGRVLQGQGRPKQERRPEDGDESGYHCFHEVSKGIIIDRKLMLDVTYGVFAEHGHGRVISAGLRQDSIRMSSSNPGGKRPLSSSAARGARGERTKRTATRAETTALSWAGPIAIGVAFVAMLTWSWRKWPDVLVDFGRELYVPWQLAQGKRLYSEVAYFLGPLSPHFNALWFRLFGPGLMTLALCNIVLTGLLTVLLFRLLRRVAGSLAVTAAVLAFVTVFAFGQLLTIGNCNYVCPYTHEAVHGLLLALVALGCWSAYLDSDDRRWLAGSGLALGLAFLTRVEPFVAGSVAVLSGLAITSWIRRAPARVTIAACGFLVGALVIPPAVAFLLLWRSLPPAQALQGTMASVLAPFGGDVTGLKFFRENMGLSTPAASLGAIIRWTGCFVAVLGPTAALSLILRKPGSHRPAIAVILFASLAGLLAALVPKEAWLRCPRPLPGAMLVIVVVSLKNLPAVRADRKTASKLIRITTLAVFALALLGKMILKTRVSHYGFTLAMPATLLLVIALLDWIPHAIQRAGGYARVFQAAALGVLVASGFGFLSITSNRFVQKTNTVGQGSDAFLADSRGKWVNLALAEIQKHVSASQTLAVLPEGAMVNYLSRRCASTAYTSFMPTELSIFGEDRILASFEARPPDFVLLVHKDTSEFGYRFFGRDYGQVVGAWIHREYRGVTLIGEEPLRDDRYGIALLRRAAPTP
jgi:4-amino-4-deoxy-L-arabinose transferase-like glycosyltransferase